MSVVIKQERGVAINPTRSCAPIGAMLGTFGIHGSLTINHGSQGCATYPRHQMSRHFREPIEVATSSLTEKTTVYGGKENLVKALYNVYQRFHPSVVTICSTCLSETIGDDMGAIIEEFEKQYPDIELPILSVRTPSYVGTHITGFDLFLTEVAKILPTRHRGKDRPINGKVNIIPGWVNPGDTRELKRMVREMGVESIFITDVSDTLDGGYYTPRPRHPIGGTTMEELRDSSSSLATIALQKHIGGEAAKTYKKRHNVPAHILPMPIGLKNTDAFIDTLSEVSGKEVPEAIQIDRARLLDAIVDTHMFNSGLRVAIYGDPDMVAGLTSLISEMGMQVAFVLTASDLTGWGEDMRQLTEELGQDTTILYKSDLYEMHKRIQAEPVDLLIGHSKGKFMADAENIPLVRVGFPIEDRFGYHRRAIVGYTGGIYLVDEITNLLLASKTIVSNTVMDKASSGLFDDVRDLTSSIPLTPVEMEGGCGNGGCGSNML